VLALLVTLALLVPSSARAGEEIVFVPLGSSAQDEVLERRFGSALVLALEDREVARVPLEGPDFLTRSTADQVATLGALVEEREALAAIWLDLASDEFLRAQLVFSGVGRSVVRLLEVPRGEGAAQDLALAAREVIATTQLEAALPPAPPPVPEEVSPVQGSPRQGSPRWMLFGSLGTNISPRARPAPAPRLEGRVLLRGRIAGGLGLSLGASVRGAPGLVNGQQLAGFGGVLQVDYGFGGERLRVGPSLGIEVGSLWYRRSPSEEDATGGLLEMRIGPGLQTGLRLARGITLRAYLRVDLLPLRHEVRDRANQGLLLQTGPADLSVGLGLAIPLGAEKATNVKQP